MVFRHYKPAVAPLLAALLAYGPAAHAFRIDASAGAGITYSDNVALLASDEIDDWIASTRLWTHLNHSTGAWWIDADMSWDHQVYLNDTYSDRDYVDLSLVSTWEQIRDRLEWNLEDYFTQIPIDSLEADTPENRIDINILRFGPSITVPVAPRHTVNLDPYFSDFYYEDSDQDNKDLGLTAAWMYDLSRVMRVGLEADYSDVDYSDALNTDYERKSLHAVLSGSSARTIYTVNLGATEFEREQLSNIDGMTGSLALEFRVTGRSRIYSTVSSELTDSSEIYLRTSSDPLGGDLSNVQNAVDVIRDELFRLEYRSFVDDAAEVSRYNTRAWLELRDMDYKETLNDREIQDLGIEYTYRISDRLTTVVNGRYVKTDSTDIFREDDEYYLGGRMHYMLSRKLRGTLDLLYQKRESNSAIFEYNEYRVFAGIEYSFSGRVPEGW